MEEKVEFNPEAEYVWDAGDNLNLKGKEFEIIHNTLSSIFTQGLPDAQMYIMLHELWKISSGIIKRNVENGLIKEKPAD